MWGSTMTRLILPVSMLAIGAPVVLLGQPPPIPMPLTYEAALDLATSRNLAVEAARRQRAIREANLRTASQFLNPDLSAESSRDTPHQAFSVGVPLELGGRRSRRISLAREELSLADGDVQFELRAVRRQVREAFYGLVASDERVQLAEGALEIARRLREIAQARFETGAAPRLEVLQADLGVARAETGLDLVRGLQTAGRATLNAILNLPPQQATTVKGSLFDHTTAPAYEQALRLASTSNPDLAAFDRLVAVEQRRADLLRAERVPTPIFSVGAVLNAPGEFTAGPRVGVSVGLPLFSRNQGEIAASLATTSLLRAERDATERAVQNAVFGALARIDAERRQIDAYQKRLVPTATELEALSEESYRAGRTSVLGVLDAQRTLRDISAEALQAALDLQVSFAELEELLGTTLP